MSRYIDTDALEEKAKQYSLGYYEADEWAVPLCEISEAPSIDIVRCSECIFDTDYYFKNDVNEHRYEWCYEFCDVDGGCPFGKKRSDGEREDE